VQFLPLGAFPPEAGPSRTRFSHTASILVSILCEDQVLDGPASGEKGSKCGPYKYCNSPRRTHPGPGPHILSTISILPASLVGEGSREELFLSPPTLTR